MIIDLIKFIHILVTLALLGTTGYCLLFIVGRKYAHAFGDKNVLRSLSKSLLYLSFLAGLTGTMLVYPKHFTFHTSWIQAAYTLVTLFFVTTLLLFVFNHRRNRKLWSFLYLFLVSLLVIVIHDAVTKTTFLF